MADPTDVPGAEAAPGAAEPPTGGSEGPPQDRSKLLGWAPPGLERVQGDLWLVARKTVVSGAVLALPLVLAIALPQSPHSLGPLGQAWWILLISTLVGLVLFADASVAILRLLRRVSLAVRGGYSMHVVGLVLSDRSRDAGFLLQGARVYSELSDAQRARMAALRTWTPILFAAAGLWLSVGFGALTLLGARGLGSPQGVALGTLLPSVFLAFAGMALTALEGSLVRKAKKAWHTRDWAGDLSVTDAEKWRAAASDKGVPARAEGSPDWALRGGMAAVVLASVVAVLSPATLVPASSVGAILGSIASFSSSRMQAGIAEVEVYRQYRLEPTDDVTPEEAGTILNVLAFVGRAQDRDEGMLPPARQYDEGWIPESAPDGWQPADARFWTETVWEEVAAGLSGEELAYLRDVADHPASAEFSRLASAAHADVVGGRYELPFAEDVAFWSLPIPRYATIRQAANVHLGTAALRLAEGRPAEAERLAREVVSVGFLLMEESPFLIGSMIGRVLAERGGEGLERVLRASGRAPQADLLEGAAAAGERAVALMTPPSREGLSSQAFLERVASVVPDTTVMRSLRWEYLGILSGLTPCLNLQRVVFGPGEDHEAWLESVRMGLVHHPAEEQLFEVMTRGFGSGGQTNWLSRLMAVSMGGADRNGSCARLVATIPGLI